MEKFFIAMPDTKNRSVYFPKDCIEELEDLGEVRLNPFDRKLSEQELIELASDCTILLTHWACPQVTASFLDAAPQLKLIAHCAGTVAHIAGEDTYQRGIPCLSANTVMAHYVAEAVLGMMLCGLRGFKEIDLQMQKGHWDKSIPCYSLFDSTVGLIGLGTVGRYLLDLLIPFGPKVKVYDPYLQRDALSRWPFAQIVDLDTALGCDVVSVHASQTPETYHMIDEQAFSRMKPNAIFINTARGSLVDTAAAAKALASEKIRGLFDVYEQEGCPQPQLAGMDNVLLLPHMAAVSAGARMTRAIIRDIRRFLSGEKPELEISYEQFTRMTQE
jgi:phosphoglycerate dehydrogenase-like enzyme